MLHIPSTNTQSVRARERERESFLPWGGLVQSWVKKVEAANVKRPNMRIHTAYSFNFCAIITLWWPRVTEQETKFRPPNYSSLITQKHRREPPADKQNKNLQKREKKLLGFYRLNPLSSETKDEQQEEHTYHLLRGKRSNTQQEKRPAQENPSQNSHRTFGQI